MIICWSILIQHSLSRFFPALTVILQDFSFTDKLHERDEPFNNFIDEPKTTDEHTPPLTDRSNGNSDIDDDEAVVVNPLTERSHKLVRCGSSEAPRNEQKREDTCNLCDNLNDEFYYRRRTSEYAPVFIDSAVGYPSDLRFKRDIHTARELDNHTFKTREYQRGPSPIVADRYFREQKEGNFNGSSEFYHHPTFCDTNHSPTHPIHLSPRHYCVGWEHERFRHDSVSPDIAPVGKQHFRGNCSPTQDEVLSLASKTEYNSTLYPAKSSSSTPSGSPCSSTPSSSTSPLSRKLSSNPFCPATPIPTCMSKSIPACERYHNPYYSWSLHSPCFQRFPYYFPPSPVVQMHSEMKHTLGRYGIGMESVGTRDEIKRDSQKNTIRDHVHGRLSPVSAKVHLVGDFESRVPKKFSASDNEADCTLGQQMPGGKVLQLDMTMDEKEGCLSLEGNQSVDENENILNEKINTSEGEELLGSKSTKGRKFTCKFCGKIYVSLGALKMHIRTHTLPCKCHICGKAFSRPWLLQGHIRTHTGEKPYKCHMCQRAFADRSNLRAHLQTHSDVKKYRCRTCHKTFSRMSLLLKHEEAGCLAS